MWETASVQCPYCWELIEIAIDPTEPLQDYVEDCAVCCRPIRLRIQLDGGSISVSAERENE